MKKMKVGILRMMTNYCFDCGAEIKGEEIPRCKKEDCGVVLCKECEGDEFIHSCKEYSFFT